jgi:two-component system, cell cycle response regulator DivK
MNRVLVVEDNEKNLKLLRDVLEYAGYRVVEAVTGEAGVRLARQERPDLILLDIRLPDIDGIEVLRRIRSDASLRGVPVLAVSASVMPDEQQRIVASGFDAFIAKPISIKPLLAAVDAALVRGARA